jgi:hypothetical protein
MGDSNCIGAAGLGKRSKYSKAFGVCAKCTSPPADLT